MTRELGQPFYERIDAPATPQQKNLLKALSPEKLAMKELAGEPVRATLTAAPGNGQSFGGIKVTSDHGWFAARPSGTEDVYKIYAESFRSEAHLQADPARSPIRDRAGASRGERFLHKASRDRTPPETGKATNILDDVQVNSAASYASHGPIFGPCASGDDAQDSQLAIAVRAIGPHCG